MLKGKKKFLDTLILEQTLFTWIEDLSPFNVAILSFMSLITLLNISFNRSMKKDDVMLWALGYLN